MAESNDLIQKVTCLAIGDNHIKTSSMKESQEMCRKIIELVKERKPDFIVNLGDTLDRHETIHSNPLCLAINFLSDLAELAPLYLNIGNHDLSNTNDFLKDVHPFTALKKWSNTKIIDKIVEADIKNHKFLFAPYVPPGRFMEALNTLPNIQEKLSQTITIFCHQEFFGAQMGAVVSQNGDKWSLSNPLVISGHIHEYQRVQENIIYVGCPMQHTFGTENIEYTVSLFTFSKDSINKVIWTEQRINLDLPRRLLVHLKPEEVLAWQVPENRITKVVISGTSAEIKATMKLDYIKQIEKKGVKVVYKTIDENQPVSTSSGLAGGVGGTSVDLKPNIPYIAKLGESVNVHPEQKYWFEKIFGMLKIKDGPMIKILNSNQ